MAKVKTIISMQGHPMQIVNVESSVGVGGVNEMTDVAVVKALLQFAHIDPSVGKLTGISQLEIPSSHDGTTYGLAGLIRRFQKGANKLDLDRKFKIVADGKINPVKQSALEGGVYYTIAALNALARRNCYRVGMKDYIDGFKRTFDHIVFDDQDRVATIAGF